MTAKRIKNFSSRASNQHQYDKFVEDSEFYEGVVNVKGKDPAVKLRNQKNIFRSDASYISIDEWCHIIYGWLLLNPAMLSVSDFYEHIRDNAPFLYTLDEVIAYDSDEIYNLLQERIKTMMLRGKIGREAALAVLKECYGWSRDDTNVNLNIQPEVSFKFGGAIPVEKNT